MVNELNKPPSQENLALGERLLASQRQLQEMQEEHRQLLQEMEVLRQRAAALSRLNEQQFMHVGDQRRSAGSLSDTNENFTNHETVGATEAATSEGDHQDSATAETTNEATEQINHLNANTTPNTDIEIQTPKPTVNDEDDEDPETAEYLQQKLAEIAKLKARFKHVQNIMNTTDKIEEHIASKGAPNSNTTALAASLESALGKLHISSGVEVQSPSVTSTTTTQPNIASSHEGNADIKTEPMNLETATTMTDDEQTLISYAPSQTANEELLSTMMNMFTDFTADLRSQADDLRAERDRLRALKEDLLRRKRQS